MTTPVPRFGQASRLRPITAVHVAFVVSATYLISCHAV